MKKVNAFPKIWFFDMEGTLLKKDHSLDNGKVAPSAWTVLAKELGQECYEEEEATKDKWLRGEYRGYLDWMRETVEIHKKYGLTKAQLDKVTSKSELHDGAHELFEYIRKNDGITVLISGGFKELANKVQKDLNINHAFSACEYFFDENGNLEFYNLLPSDNEGKATFMKLITREYGVDPMECVFVGDGKNDIYLANQVGLSIAFNAQKELVNVSTYSVNQHAGKESLLDIIKLLS